MGCDIHLVVEVRDGHGSAWHPKLIETTCCDCGGLGKYENGTECYRCKGSKRSVGYSSRNYDTFAILANVRNGSGFAGCDTGDGFVPISEPRGFPDDMSAEVRAAIDGESDDVDDNYDRNQATIGCGWLGDHSHTWVTLAELLAYDWSRTTKKRGVMSLGDWAAWKKSGTSSPGSYSGDVWGCSVRKVNEVVAAELARCIRFGTPAQTYDAPEPAEFMFDDACRKAWEHVGKLPPEELYRWASGERLSVVVPIQWGETYAESASFFHATFIPALVEQGNGPENTRLVFGFDS